MSPVPNALHHAEPLLLLAVVLVAGSAFGALARRLGVPGITGQIVGGVAMGGLGFQVFSDQSLAGLEPLTDIALSLIAVTVGAHLHLVSPSPWARTCTWCASPTPSSDSLSC